MRLFVSACISFAVVAVGAYATTLPPIPPHSGWITLKNAEENDGFKIFRRYGYLGGTDNPLQNLIMFNCSKDVTKAASHLTFVLPKGFQPDLFPRTTWLPKIEARFQINDKLSVLMPTEYHNGELYFDLSSDTKDNFDKVMLADTLAIGFGDKNDIIQFEFTDRVDDFFAEYMKESKTHNSVR